MNLEVLDVKMKKREDVSDFGYIVDFTEVSEDNGRTFSMPVIYGSHVDTFLKFLRDDVLRIVTVDGCAPIIALADNTDKVELVRDVILEDFSSRVADGNIKAITEKYGVRLDVLESTIKESVKDSNISVRLLGVAKDSSLSQVGIKLSLSSDKEGSLIVCPSGSAQSKFLLGLVSETDEERALEQLIGREMYVATYALNVIALVDKETKKVCLIRTSYGFDGKINEYASSLKDLEINRDIPLNTLDLRIKRLVANEERSN